MQKNLAHILNEITGGSSLGRLRLIGYNPLDEDQDRAHGLVNAVLQQKFHSLTTLKLPFIIPSREDLHKLLLFPALTNFSIGVNESLVVRHYYYYAAASLPLGLTPSVVGTSCSTRPFGAGTAPTLRAPPPTALVSICGCKSASHAGHK